MPKLREPPKQEEEQVDPAIAKQEEVVVVSQQEDAAEEMKKQLEALRASEATARQQLSEAATQRDQAIRYAQERDVALSRSQSDASNSQLQAVTSAIATANSEIEEAKQAFRMGAAQEDIEAQIAAQEKLAEAKANLVNLTNGKSALERAIRDRQERAKIEATQRQQQPAGDQLDRTNLPQNAKDWLRAHPDYLTDPRKNSKIQSLHWDVVDEGHQPFSTGYYERLEQHLGLREKPRQIVAEEEGDAEPARTIVSAPVSRESHSSNGERNTGTIRLTVAQREAAKMAGITDAEYAKQLVVLRQAKTNGNYGGAP